jgi:hypothetical protein
LLAILGAQHILHVSRIRVKAYIYKENENRNELAHDRNQRRYVVNTVMNVGSYQSSDCTSCHCCCLKVQIAPHLQAFYTTIAEEKNGKPIRISGFFGEMWNVLEQELKFK